jgi:perosamine synthetase
MMKEPLDLEKVVHAIQSVLPQDHKTIALHEPQLQGQEWNYVKDCLDSGWISSIGSYVNRFENELAQYTGAKYAIAVSNGTAALHICLKLAGVEPEDEVFVPALTFIATANAVSYCGAIPHLVDSSTITLGLDPSKLKDYLNEISEIRGGCCYNKCTGRRIKAVIPMHTFGHPVDLDPLVELCLEYRLTLVEDAAQSLGTLYKGRHVGSFGQLAAISFNGNKIISTGGGGAILTDDAALAAMARHLTTTAKVPHRWRFSHDHIGYNYRLSNIHAALGCAQLEQLPLILQKKRHLAERYQLAFESLESISCFKEPEFASSNYWLNVLLLDEPYAEYLDELLEITNNQGWMCRPAWTPLHQLPLYSTCPRMDLSISESLARRMINVPSGPLLGDLYATT